jgi:DNA polymerase elongation subunit (family B)
MKQLKDIVQALGFELLYADTDSVFLEKDGAPIEEFENVKEPKRFSLSLTEEF